MGGENGNSEENVSQSALILSLNKRRYSNIKKC
jgi:hypothetical protein